MEHGGGLRPARADGAAQEAYARFPGCHAFFGRISDQTVMLSERLVEVSPFEPGRVFYTNSGSEANDTMTKVLWRLGGAEGKPERRGLGLRKLWVCADAIIASKGLTAGLARWGR